MAISNNNHSNTMMNQRFFFPIITPRIAFLLVSLSLGQLGDGLNIFQGIYLVGSMNWKEGSVGLALSLMGLTSLLIQPLAGDWVDKTTIDRRMFLGVAAIMTALSASCILLVTPDSASGSANYFSHLLIYTTKIVEGITASFLAPCLAALTLASFGPTDFDQVMASNIFWGHVGSVASAVLAGIVSYVLYPEIKLCFLVIGASALVACLFVPSLPQGDPLLGRGFAVKEKDSTNIQDIDSDETSLLVVAKNESRESDETDSISNSEASVESPSSRQFSEQPPQAFSYWDVLADRKSIILCMTGFFFHFANANVLLVLGEMMGGSDNTNGGAMDNSENDKSNLRNAIPLTAGNIVTAQVFMALATYLGDRLTLGGVGRKPLFLAALIALPVRCALILYFQQMDANVTALMSTQILDGIAGGLMGLIQPYLIADITFGTGRFNMLMGATASCFGMGATLSNYLGQMVVEKFDHAASLTASLIISCVPVLLFLSMPETLGTRTSANRHKPSSQTKQLIPGSTCSLSSDGSIYGSLDC